MASKEKRGLPPGYDLHIPTPRSRSARPAR